MTSSTYQASISEFRKCGLTTSEAYQLIKKGIEIAQEEASAREPHALVAAGFGPYGAFLCEGQEYTGNYGRATLDDFRSLWLPRVEAAIECKSQILLCETIPSFVELQFLTREVAPMAKQKSMAVWISLSLSLDPRVQLADGTDMASVLELVNASVDIDLIGANCFDAHQICAVLDAFDASKKPLILYPNHGEIYDGITKEWTRSDALDCFSPDMVRKMVDSGAKVIGGCCNTTPDTILKISAEVHK